jgi:hypothetical protein
MSTGPGAVREACGDGGRGVVEILKRDDFEDHWQVLMPDWVSDLALGVRDGGPEIGGWSGVGGGDRSVA